MELRFFLVCALIEVKECKRKNRKIPNASKLCLMELVKIIGFLDSRF